MTLSFAQVVVVLILGVSSFLSGWMLRRIQAKSREAGLQKRINDADTTIPSLETNIRNRDQRIASLVTELTEWKTRVPSLEAAAKRKDVEVLAKDRELKAAEARVAALTAELTARDAAPAAPAFVSLPVAPVSATAAELEAIVDRLRAELETGKRTQQELRARLDVEVAEVAKWQARVPKLLATIKARDATLAGRDELLTARDAQVAERDARLAERDAQLAERTAQLADRDVLLTERGAQLAQRDAELTLRNSEIATRDAMVTQRDALLDERNAQLSRGVEETQALRQALDAQLQSLAERDSTIAALEQRVAAAIGERDAESAQFATKLATALRLGREEVDRHRAEFQIMRDELEAERAHHAQTAAAAAEAAQQHANVEAELNAHCASLDAHSTSLETQLTALHAQLAEYDAARDADAEARAALQRELAQAREERAAAESALEARAAIERDHSDQSAELAELRDEVRELHTRFAPLESLLKQRDAALAERAERVDALTAQLQAQATQIESQQTMLRQRGERIGALERKLADAPVPVAPAEPNDRRSEHLEQRLVAQIEKNRELSKMLEEHDRDAAAALKAKELNEKSMVVLKQQLDDARATEERMAAQIRDLKAASQRAPEPSPMPAKAPMAKPAGLFELPPDDVDELQQIRGIGDGFERGLNKLGIYQFRQLAGLSAAEIVWIEAHLPTFHGRIERDDWPGQAAALMAATQHAEWSLRAQNPHAESPRVN